MKKKSPPSLAVKFIETMLDPHVRYSALGDFEERYHSLTSKKGRFRAYLFFWFQTILLFPPFIKNSIYWSFQMIKNFLKTGFRNIKKHKGYAFINIAGLTVGLALFILIALYIQHELSFDRFHTNSDRIYRVEQVLAHESGTEKTAGCPTPLAEALSQNFPDFTAVTRVINRGGILLATQDNTKFSERGVFAVDQSFLDIFSFPLIKGDRATALTKPFSLIISNTLAKKIFQEKDPMGQVLQADNRYDVTITGVFKDVPPYSHLQFHALLSVSTYPSLYGDSVFTRWFDNWIPVYVMLPPGHSLQGVNEKIHSFLKKFQGERSRNELYLRPLSKIHLYADVNHEIGLVGSIKNVNIFAAVSLFVLIIACINYMNMSTARSADRNREVGLRKVVGATKSSLVKQFLGESFMTVTLAMASALILARIFLPEFSHIVNRKLSLDLAGNWIFSLGLIGLILIVSGLAGIYPSFFLSSLRPIETLKGTKHRGSGNIFLRKSLVVFQFFISIGLIIGTVIILQQHKYLLNKDLGYSSDQILAIPTDGNPGRIKAFQHELSNNPNILNVGISDYMPHSSTNWCYVSWEGAGAEDYMKINVNYVDEHLISTYGMTIVKGNKFSKDMRGRKENVVILNETAAAKIGWKDPIGKRIRYNIDYRSRTVGGASVVGIVKDYHFLSLHHTIGPIMMRLLPEDGGGGRFSVKISARNMASTIAFIKAEYEKLFTKQIFHYSFLDEDFQQMYLEEKKAGRVILYLALIAVFIACLGLFGLSSYSTKQRTKEIGIRKVMGASVSNVSFLLTKEFIKLVLLANFISWPVAFLLMNGWLKNFPYRIHIRLAVFLSAGCAALIIALATVGYQAILAARSNPSESLRYE
ncbi:MAG: ABC transporter permease [Candidatus Aminicenantes bacterium]|nr:ABC transporter permease [Candidatus Aminicenantes bacterium]